MDKSNIQTATDPRRKRRPLYTRGNSRFNQEEGCKTAVTLRSIRALPRYPDSSTNAGAIRQIVGRGSFATIQKHLDAIRAELAPVPPVAPGTAPGAPTMLIDQVWVAAWTAAQALTFGRLETVTAERDAARALAETRAQDVAALAREVDTLAEITTDAKAAAAMSKEALVTFGERAELELAEHATAIAAANAEIEKLKTEAAAAAALAARDAQIERQALQSTIDRLTDQCSDLKSLLARLTPTQK